MTWLSQSEACTAAKCSREVRRPRWAGRIFLLAVVLVSRASVSSGGSSGGALTPVPGLICEKLWETVAVGFLLACHSTGGCGSICVFLVVAPTPCSLPSQGCPISLNQSLMPTAACEDCPTTENRAPRSFCHNCVPAIPGQLAGGWGIAGDCWFLREGRQLAPISSSASEAGQVHPVVA